MGLCSGFQDGKQILAGFSLSSVERVTFFKRDEITTDLICCQVVSSGQVQTIHEEMPIWDALIGHLVGLPGFRQGRVRQGGVISAVAVGHRQAALAVMCRG